MNTPKQAEFEDRLSSWARQSEQAQTQLALVRGKGTAVDGYLVVIVDVAGKMLSITTDSPVEKLRAQDLQSAIMRAYKLACHDAEKQSQEITSELYEDPEIRAVLKKINPNQTLPEESPPAVSVEIDEEEWNDSSRWLRRRRK